MAEIPVAFLRNATDLCRGRLFFLAYAGFLAGFFLFPEAPEHYRYYYILVLLPLLLGCGGSPALLYRDRLFQVAAVYIAYMVLSSLWSEPFEGAALARVVWYGLLVLSFLAATALLRAEDEVRFERLLGWLSILAAVSALVSTLLWYREHAFPVTRLQPWGRINHEILGGCVYGLFALIALQRLLSVGDWQRRALFAGGALVLLCAVLLTQSRTALVALLVGSIIVTGKRRLHWWLLVMVILAALIALLQPGLWHGVTRSMPYRLDIWSAVLSGIKEHWLIGQGYLSATTVETTQRTFVHAHSAYLATLRDGGVIGLVLLLGTLGTALWIAWKVDRHTGRTCYTAMIVYGVLCALPDLDRLLLRPKEPWLFFWLPIALVMLKRSPGEA